MPPGTSTQLHLRGPVLGERDMQLCIQIAARRHPPATLYRDTETLTPDQHDRYQLCSTNMR